MPDLKMPEINNVTLAGRLTRDPESSVLKSGGMVCEFGIAVSRHWRDKDGQPQEETAFVQIVAWNRLADWCGVNLRKGDPVYVKGRMTTSKWEDTATGKVRSNTEVHAFSVQALSWPEELGQKPQRAEQQQVIGEDDIPF